MLLGHRIVVGTPAHAARIYLLAQSRCAPRERAFYRRLAARIVNAKAVTATARKIAVLVYNAMRYGMHYVYPGANHPISNTESASSSSFTGVRRNLALRWLRIRLKGQSVA